jgi:hypothetical protein
MKRTAETPPVGRRAGSPPTVSAQGCGGGTGVICWPWTSDGPRQELDPPDLESLRALREDGAEEEHVLYAERLPSQDEVAHGPDEMDVFGVRGRVRRRIFRCPGGTRRIH